MANMLCIVSFDNTENVLWLHMAHNTNITNSLNILQPLIEDKEIDENAKNMFYYFSNLYLESKGLDSYFPRVEFEIKNIKEEDARVAFPHDPKLKNVSEKDVFDYFTRFDPKNKKKIHVWTKKFVINFHQKTVEEKLDFIKKNHKHMKELYFINTMLYYTGNEDIKSKVYDKISGIIPFDQFGDFRSLNSFYNSVERKEFIRLVFKLEGDVDETVVFNKLISYDKIDKEIAFSILIGVFLAKKKNDDELAKNLLMKMLDLNRSSCYTSYSENNANYIPYSYFAKKFIPKIVFYANSFEDSLRKEVFSNLIDSCITANLRTFLMKLRHSNYDKVNSLSIPFSLFEIVRNIVELEIDPENYDIHHFF